MIQTGLSPAGLPSQQKGTEGNSAAVNPSWNSRFCSGNVNLGGKRGEIRRKVQRLLPPGFIMSDDAFDVLYQATRAAFSSLVGPVDSATFQMIVGPRAVDFVKLLRDLGTANAWGGEHCIGIACRLFKINMTISHAHLETYARGDSVNDHQKQCLPPNVPPTPKLKSMPFLWTAVQKQVLFDCYREAGRLCKGVALKTKLLEMFQVHYPDFQQAPSTLLKRYFDFSKERERISSSCLAASTSISADADDDYSMDEMNYGIVHPKDHGVPDMLRVAYGSKYLEEKIWVHIFWQGTGGFYPKTAAAAAWSRRDYVEYRLLMFHPAFRDEPAWIFYQTDQLIKEQILNYNMNTVKVADLVNPLSKEDIERQEKDLYKRVGTNMPAYLLQRKNTVCTFR
ncbi:hypothetical protein BV898_07436 [Hypsibius exemplaris]|uniref:Uncharacterized protein n=1 Tax=Hypsibius exemplaris TaxID=2072580 RepID=A0A1W0WTB8_HYPEX|nr:hypothetical protein BV898_07436 [Hypsibius exemplaris]